MTSKNVRKYARAHLAGIEGGRAGAVADFRAGVRIDAACGLGDWWQLPASVSVIEVEAEVRRIVRQAAEEI